MSDSDDRPDQAIEAHVHEAIREMRPEVEALLQEGHVLLTGPATVQLMVTVEEALTPQEAVDSLLRRLAYNGANTFTFAVTDNLSGEDFFVRAGQLLSLESVMNEARNKDEDEDEPT